jgi:hypothetical protein
MLNVLLIHEKIRIPLPPALCNIFGWTKRGFSKMSACVRGGGDWGVQENVDNT